MAERLESPRWDLKLIGCVGSGSMKEQTPVKSAEMLAEMNLDCYDYCDGSSVAR
jgi:hypothetical protein